MNFYNEIDPYAAQWLRNLIADKQIPKGHVDERSITEVTLDDLRGYTQHHFFAGIGGWSIALALAGWPDNRPVWTGSCPCQPYSVAGKQRGQSDERHLWPAWFSLICQYLPDEIFGEQVTGAIAKGWLDDVAYDLEGKGYAIAAPVLPACSVGAPHKRDRLWFVAHSDSHRHTESQPGSVAAADRVSRIDRQENDSARQPWGTDSGVGGRGAVCGSIAPDSSADTDNARLQGRDSTILRERAGERFAWESSPSMGNAGEPAGARNAGAISGSQAEECREGQQDGNRLVGFEPAGASRGEGSVANTPSWLQCPIGTQRDERGLQETILRESRYSHNWHVEPAVGRVADGIQARSHKLRAYGNAIVPQVAAEIIRAYMECRP